MARVDVKVCLLGSSGVGKTCMLDRYINDQFEPSPKNTIGAAFAAKKVRVQDGKTITLGVWDTAGAEQFESLSRMYYHGSRAAVVCFDACQRASFDKLQFWVNELRTNEPHCRIYIVATKADLLEGSGRGGSRKPAVSADAAQKFAAGADATVTYTSAKTGRGITELFQGIAEALAASLGDGGTPRPPYCQQSPRTRRWPAPAATASCCRLARHRRRGVHGQPRCPAPAADYGSGAAQDAGVVGGRRSRGCATSRCGCGSSALVEVFNC